MNVAVGITNDMIRYFQYNIQPYCELGKCLSVKWYETAVTYLTLNVNMYEISTYSVSCKVYI